MVFIFFSILSRLKSLYNGLSCIGSNLRTGGTELTRSGAFSIGSLSRVDEELKDSQVIILSPTRELADQTFKVITELSSYTKISSCKVVGGTRVSDGIQDLRKNPQVIVGTPGRILDMLQK